MYARLRGVPEVMIANVVQDLINALLLEEHADKLTSSYRYILLYDRLVIIFRQLTVLETCLSYTKFRCSRVTEK